MIECPNGFWCMQLKDWLNVGILVITAAAIAWSPIYAVYLSRRQEEKREKLRRQYEIFHNLMKTRKTNLAPDHVSSLNAIQTDFCDNPRVISAYKTYIGLLYRTVPPPSEPQDQIKHFFEEQDNAFIELIFQMARTLGVILDKDDISKYSYAPIGWGNVESQQNLFRGLLIELLTGKRGLPVVQYRPGDASGKFPPPP